MADYIYLLETRLSLAQQRAIGAVRTIARENELTIFLTGGAVRDLTGGGSIRDLDLTVQGSVAGLKQALEEAGAQIQGEHAEAQQLFLSFPGGVRVELSGANSVSYPKPGKPKYEAGSLSDDLRSRDFTANAMAISLNDGSYGLLIDPLNGVADIENRELRLVNNYGFIEDPSRLIRAARLASRLGWQMEERTRQRYDVAKEEGYISALAAWNRGYELEEIFHEEDPVRILRALEAEQWMQFLFPALESSRANSAALADLAERQGQLQIQGILAQPAALAFPFVTAKMSPGDVAALKALFVRPGFVREVETVDARMREFSTRFASKEAATPSAAWKMLHSAEPNLVLAMSVGSKAASLQTRLKTFLTDSPTARQRIPYALMQEMRITPDLPEYTDLIDRLFFELMDGKLSTQEEMKAFLEPYSPPAPPPPINLRRARAKKEVRPSRAKGKKAADAEESTTVAAAEEAEGVETGLMEPGTLTSMDRGPEPTPTVPLEGKVAPEAPPAAEPKKAATEPAPVPASSKAAKTDLKVQSETAKAATPKPEKAAGAASTAKKAPQQIVVVPAKSAPTAKKATQVFAAPSGKSAEKKGTAGKGAPEVSKKSVPLKKVAAPAKKAVIAKSVAPIKKAVPAPAKKTTPPPQKAAKATGSAKKSAVKVPAKKGAPAKAAAKKPSGRR